MFSVRMSVRENILNNVALVTDEICATYITQKGRGWVYEADGRIVGFGIADLEGHSIWALFLLPEYEGQGIGRQLQDTMLNWYFSCTDITIWLTTAPGTRAERFYTRSGWQAKGLDKGEIRFEMTAGAWGGLQRQA